MQTFMKASDMSAVPSIEDTQEQIDFKAKERHILHSIGSIKNRPFTKKVFIEI